MSSGQKVVTLGQMDINKFRLGTELKSGINGDKYVELFYDDARFTYDVCKLPEYARCPFKAGPATRARRQARSWATRGPLPLRLPTSKWPTAGTRLRRG